MRSSSSRSKSTTSTSALVTAAIAAAAGDWVGSRVCGVFGKKIAASRVGLGLAMKFSTTPL
jgi:hypothetical protein